MAFLSKLTAAFSRETPVVSLTATTLPGASFVSVVGESHRQPALERTAQMASYGAPPFPITALDADAEPDLPWFQAILVREPNNQYDPNAVMVYSTWGHLGYLSRENALLYQDVLLAIEEGGSQGGVCAAFMRRAENGMWGVVLCLSDPDICLEELEL